MNPQQTTDNTTKYRDQWYAHITELSRIKQTLDPQADSWDQLDEIQTTLKEIVDEAAATVSDRNVDLSAGELIMLTEDERTEIRTDFATITYDEDTDVFRLSGPDGEFGTVDPDRYDGDVGAVLARITQCIILEMEEL